jgi:cysteine-rich repeat protein
VLPLLGKGYEAMRIETKVTCSCLAVGMACVTAFGQANFQFGVAAVFDSDGSLTPAPAGTGDSGDVMDPLRIMVDDRQISVEAFVTLSVEYRVLGHDVNYPCEFLSDIAGRPPITYTPGSVALLVRTDSLLTVSNAVQLLAPGSCDESIPCTHWIDCPPDAFCVAGSCTQSPIRTGSIVLPATPGDIVFEMRPPGTYYVGEALYDIPAGAAGDYSARPACLWSDDGCSEPLTTLPVDPLHSSIPTTASDLIIRIPSGACCDGSFCAEDVLESACPSPLAWNPDAACADVDCVAASCGNGVVQFGEDCDDAGESVACNADCTSLMCGDGILNRTGGEQCDDSNTDDLDGCSSVCEIEGAPPVPAMTTSGSVVLVLLLVIGLATTAGRRDGYQA